MKKGPNSEVNRGADIAKTMKEIHLERLTHTATFACVLPQGMKVEQPDRVMARLSTWTVTCMNVSTFA